MPPNFWFVILFGKRNTEERKYDEVANGTVGEFSKKTQA